MAKNDDWDADDLDDEIENGNSGDTADAEDSARSRRLLFGALKIIVSLALLGGAAVFLFAPEKIPAPVMDKLKQASPVVKQARHRVESVISKITDGDKPTAPAPAAVAPVSKPPVNFAQKRTAPAEQSPAASEVKETAPLQNSTPQPQQKRFNLRGYGKIPDLLTAIAGNPSLKDTLLKADVYTFEQLPKLRPFVQSFILQWAQADSPEAIEQLAGVPFKTFENQVLVELLPFTTFRRAKLTPSYDANLIKETPTDAASTLFMYLKPIVDEQQTTQEKLAFVEPVSTFLLYRCGRDADCLASWDLLLDMLDLSDYKDQLKQW
ncbi:MAG TPA: hypothetical protein DD624_03740 [Alphaproteobacteria bacterium]|nr:hypothetical protein [Alphaproteobacteria bacterium]